mmetsp:Transcript_60387/g.143946  ORF Transcript_60387/g.143946 Transcript_60387/m.143946 type:complete len:711 (+) Transcript_60387:100-2232(+)
MRRASHDGGSSPPAPQGGQPSPRRGSLPQLGAHARAADGPGLPLGPPPTLSPSMRSKTESNLPAKVGAKAVHEETHLSEIAESNGESSHALSQTGPPPIPEDYDRVQVAELENRLREFFLDLIQPTIKKGTSLEVEVHNLAEQCQTNTHRLHGLAQSAIKAGQQMQVIDSVREEMSRWEAERYASQAATKDQLAQMRSELDRFRYSLEQKDASIHSVNRTLDRLISEVTTLQDREAVMQGNVESRLSQQSKTLNSARMELEAKMIALETRQHKIADEVWGEEAGLAKVTADLVKTREQVDSLAEELKFVHEAKNILQQLQGEQEEVASHVRDAEGHIHDLRMMNEGIVKDIKEHFDTATATVTAHNAAMLQEVRTSYSQELAQWEKLRGDMMQFMEDTATTMAKLGVDVEEARNRNEEMICSFQADLENLHTQRNRDKGNAEVDASVMRERISMMATTTSTVERALEHIGGVLWTLLQSSRASSALDMQDNSDRTKVALIGYTEKKAETLPAHAVKNASRPHSERRVRNKGGLDAGASEEGDGGPPMISVDQRCLSCSGQAQTVLSGFKMACLQYTPGPVTHGKKTWTRGGLLEMRQKLLEQAHTALQEGPVNFAEKAFLHRGLGDVTKQEESSAPPSAQHKTHTVGPTPPTSRGHGKQLGFMETQSTAVRQPSRESTALTMEPITPPSTSGTGFSTTTSGFKMPPISAR